jgi:hypothetical protein
MIRVPQDENGNEMSTGAEMRLVSTPVVGTSNGTQIANAWAAAQAPAQVYQPGQALGTSATFLPWQQGAAGIDQALLGFGMQPSGQMLGGFNYLPQGVTPTMPTGAVGPGSYGGGYGYGGYGCPGYGAQTNVTVLGIGISVAAGGCGCGASPYYGAPVGSPVPPVVGAPSATTLPAPSPAATTLPTNPQTPSYCYDASLGGAPISAPNGSGGYYQSYNPIAMSSVCPGAYWAYPYVGAATVNGASYYWYNRPALP